MNFCIRSIEMKFSSQKCSLKIETSRALHGSNFPFSEMLPFLLRCLYLQLSFETDPFFISSPWEFFTLPAALQSARPQSAPFFDRFEIELRVACREHYFLRDCSRHCEPKNDNYYGHFYCTSDGVMVCRKSKAQGGKGKMARNWTFFSTRKRQQRLLWPLSIASMLKGS